MNRSDFQQLAELRLKDSEALLASGQWQAAYYLLGYSVECALKARISQEFQLHEVPDRKLINGFFTHRLEELLALSKLKPLLDARYQTDPIFAENWDTVVEWNEAARYELDIPEMDARAMHEAVSNQLTGILPWLKTLW